ncbi:DUF805 domain-containing protein [Vibrio genomosp. F10 str. 9ZC157]|uniref:DUF805 domain-containing protein n=1 Tax=Vibrio genomosp. F10 TaxID=723171 RepID=UPI0002EFA709|nr:DUF805 domain-containing protein [Vibrio genomosp. F10]OEE95831.1 hypothetical protein A1QM_17700 [Vibrio genomosp. F10 str. 9ZC157]
MEWYLGVLKKYTVFEGRARRKEYWMFILINLIISFALQAIDRSFGTQFLSLIYGLAVLLPAIAVSVRRLHDIDKSGWWLLISFIPFIGCLVLIYFYTIDGKPGENQYGTSPKWW